MRWLALVLTILAAPADAVTCTDMTWEGLSFSTCQVDPANEDLRLFLNDAGGKTLGSFAAIEPATGQSLQFAMNAGMYHPDRRPVGLYIEDRQQIAPLVSRAGPGNFGMLPNGVFCIGDSFARVLRTEDYRNDTPDCRYATQSGPMLVIGDDLHPRFIPGGTSKYIRNGVGADIGGPVYFAISNQPVNFYDFARFFRDGLGVQNALYLDGNVSRLYAPDLGRNDTGLQLGPIVGVLR